MQRFDPSPDIFLDYIVPIGTKKEYDMNGYDYSLITEAIVLFTWAVPPWFLFISFRESGRNLRDSWLAFAVALAWAAGAWILIKVDFGISGSLIYDARPLLIMFASVGLTALFARRIVGPGLNQKWLVGLQLFRAIGMVFVLEWARGNLTGIFAHPAGWGDLAAALTALAVLIRARGREMQPGEVYAVVGVGVVDAISAFFFGFFSSATPVQLFSHNFPNVVIQYPTGLIPLYLICFAVCMHVLSLAELRRSSRTT
jgi:hypothetical protein